MFNSFRTYLSMKRLILINNYFHIRQRHLGVNLFSHSHFFPQKIPREKSKIFSKLKHQQNVILTE